MQGKKSLRGVGKAPPVPYSAATVGGNCPYPHLLYDDPPLCPSCNGILWSPILTDPLVFSMA